MTSRYPGSTIRNVRYQLGGIVGGRLYYYTEIPAARTLEAALAMQAARPGRNACDVIVEEGDLWRAGACWGKQTAVRSAIDGALLPDFA